MKKISKSLLEEIDAVSAPFKDDEAWKDKFYHPSSGKDYDHHTYKTYGSHSYTKGSGYKPCYTSHPPLPLGGGLKIYGGNCGTPAVPDADVYVGLDRISRDTNRRYPWRPGHEFDFIIKDGSVPDNLVLFREMVGWLIAQIRDGKKVHIGCIGGHGRTGLVLSAIVSVMKVSPDPIAYVRENYCKKAVETKVQVDWLMENFDCKTAAPSKVSHYGSSSGEVTEKCLPFDQKQSFNTTGARVKGKSCIWGKNADKKI